MDKHRQMAVKVIYLAIALLKGDLGVDVRDSCREDRQLYLWHAEIVATFGQKSSLLSLFNRSKTVSSHFLFLPIFHPEGSGVLRLGFRFPTDHARKFPWPNPFFPKFGSCPSTSPRKAGRCAMGNCCPSTRTRRSSPCLARPTAATGG